MLAGLSRNSRLRYAVAFITAIMYLILYDGGIFEQIEMAVLSERFQLRTPKPPPDEIVIVSVDDTTYRGLGLSYLKPVPRLYHTQLINRLRELGVKRVAFDFVFRDWAVNDENLDLAEAFASHPTVLAQDKYLRTRTNLEGKPQV